MLGLIGYYHKFIPAYSDLVRSLTQLTHNNIPFIWTNQCQKSSELLKEALLWNMIFFDLDSNKGHTLSTDASK